MECHKMACRNAVKEAREAKGFREQAPANMALGAEAAGFFTIKKPRMDRVKPNMHFTKLQMENHGYF
jgi:hypothetical protein